MEIGIIISFLIFSIWLWINTLAILCLFLDPDLEPVQRWGQTIAVALFPFIGASFILYLANEHSPEVVSKFYIPWPFSKLVKSKPGQSHGGAEEREEIPGLHSATHFNSNHTDGGSD
jgi:hypothetical protein